jgi:hypothetical protein
MRSTQRKQVLHLLALRAHKRMFVQYTIANMVVTMKGVSFPQPGVFLAELLLDNQWVADTTVELK